MFTSLAIAVGALIAPAVAASSNLEWSPTPYDFGPKTYGTGPADPHEFVLTNVGLARVRIKGWRYSYTEAWPGAGDPFFETGGNSCLDGDRSLEPQESCSIDVYFDPLHPGNWWGQIKARGEGEEEWSELTLTGQGVGPIVPTTPGRLVFDPVVVGVVGVPSTIVVENQDRKDLEIEDISIVGSATMSSPSINPFQVPGGTCDEGSMLAPGDTCTIEVAFAPIEAGIVKSELVISDSAPDSPQSVELDGSATAAPMTVLPSAGQGPTTDQPTTEASATPLPAKPVSHTCPRKRRSVIKKGRRVCIVKHKTRRRPHRTRR